MAALANHRALVSAGLPSGIGGCPYSNKLFIVDLQARAAAVTSGCTALTYGAAGQLGSSADGTGAVIANLSGSRCYFVAYANYFSNGPFTAYNSPNSAIEGDGSMNSVGKVFADLNGNILGTLAQPDVYFDSRSGYPAISVTYPRLRPRLNFSGSLY